MAKWVGFFFRGFMALLISIVLFQPDPSFLNGRFYIGFFFVVNGLLSLKIAKQLENRDKWTIVAAFVGIIGGVIVLLLRLSTLILAFYSLPPLDLGKYLFAPITIIIGLFQVQGRIQITPDLGYKSIARRFSVVLGILEILLGIAVLSYETVVWQVIIIAHIWIIIVMVLMFATAYRVHKLETAQRTQPVSQE